MDSVICHHHSLSSVSDGLSLFNKKRTLNIEPNMQLVHVSLLFLNLLTVTPPFLNRHENAHFELKWL